MKKNVDPVFNGDLGGLTVRCRPPSTADMRPNHLAYPSPRRTIRPACILLLATVRASYACTVCRRHNRRPSGTETRSHVSQDQCSRSAVVSQGLATRLNCELASGIKSDSAGERTTVYGMNKVEQVRPKLRLCRRVTAA